MEPVMKSDRPLKELTDEELILLFQNGDEEAFDMLVARFKDPLMNYLYRQTGNLDDAEDVLQETFIRLYTKKHLYRTVAKVSTWLYTIAINQARTSMRKRRKRTFVPVAATDALDEYEIDEVIVNDTSPLPDTVVEESFRHDRIQQALQQLREEYREAVILCDIEGFEYEEIAGMLEIPVGTVKSRINRGRHKLQYMLKDIYQ
jgi:RNA polymerase sigma-70 factor (ECF subfamily)